MTFFGLASYIYSAMKVFFHLRIKPVIIIFGGIILSPALLFLSRRKTNSDQLRILIIPQSTRIGDLVLTTPVFRAIKKKYPGAYLGVALSKKSAGIVKNNPHIDKIFILRSAGFWKDVLEIRKASFDWSFCLSGSALGNIVSLWCFIPNRAKITRRPRPFLEFLTDWLATYKLRYEHHTYLPRYYLRILKPLGINNSDAKSEIFISDSGEKGAEKYFKDKNIYPSDTVVGISITAGNKIKEWGDEKFRKLARKIKAKYNAKIIFIGGVADKNRIAKIFSDKNFFEATDFSLKELPSLIRRLTLYIAVDTGPIYIAHALNVPLVDIIGPVDPSEQPPSDKRSVQVLPAPGIKPSSFVLKKPGRLAEHKMAIESIKVEDVLMAVDKLLTGL
ncbi:hypothetical protein A3H65_04045 [Candidatus Giovannonibacteria bacterium RIFCSPLOWO2_02_FULL_45_14]|uniref:Glycosyl transferase family 9 n=1 Tax=Candidatus Giovannonibacteria bacterium RIFCSPLOWO2_12_FULL_44_15 TaxID=1798364 RepID=A0A1F5Y122_9BACT|nr:MAG: hypothetical protein A3C75_03245 [Candidatus Giovannonibacteria bacterium RIFCSPHIGHO2_02_FULL_44_31]OGF76660.1 MAG: hypothetical protein A3E62_03455 [Candidatus Giovannonibacteria bacterium RIFCSPHIGHO2_12_FULL_44_29]OGF91234.1 MAG: hypothetical protein A3H65_04045 [Candidatus Giovannonibacteria bacterium RIFCSPLOWO2_02_FULL_45_14]OGF93746.1 MAG: hypothetical protein A3G54_04315 [Candidatus Giovannonibacteria bacterium RIFCSPLOWO2_12_FULL_44_15]